MHSKALYDEHAPEKKTVLKGAVALAFVAIAAAAIYNREAIMDFATGQYNHIVGGALAGDAPAIGNGLPPGLSQDVNGTWGWHAQS